jgi:hypothetical protein
MKCFSIVYESYHGRQTDNTYDAKSTKIDLSMRMATKIDLTSLSGTQCLESLDLSKNRLESINLEPLSNIKTLRRLNLGGNRLEEIDLWPLRGLDSLDAVDLVGNRLREVNLTPVIQKTACQLDDDTKVGIDRVLRYVVGGKDTARITLYKPTGEKVEKSPRLQWKNYNELVPRSGWPAVRRYLVKIIEALDQRVWFRAQKGLLEGFQMEELSGFDGDPMLLLEHTDGLTDYANVRDKIYDNAIVLLEEQIDKGGPTLFLDLQKMSDTRASKLVSLISAARAAEILKVAVQVGGNRVNLFPLWLTYYGSELLRVLRFGLTTDLRGLDLVSRNLGQIGYNLRTQEVDPSSSMRPENVSEGLVDFMYSIASMN